MTSQIKLATRITKECETCTRVDCSNCKHAIPTSHRFYCAKIRELVEKVINCPHFELEPIEYRLFIRE